MLVIDVVAGFSIEIMLVLVLGCYCVVTSFEDVISDVFV